MAKQIITKEEAEQAAIEQNQPPESVSQPEPTKGVKFRASNVGLVYFQDGTTFAFHKPILTITDPVLIDKLTEIATRTPTHIHLLEPQPA